MKDREPRRSKWQNTKFFLGAGILGLATAIGAASTVVAFQRDQELNGQIGNAPTLADKTQLKIEEKTYGMITGSLGALTVLGFAGEYIIYKRRKPSIENSQQSSSVS